MSCRPPFYLLLLFSPLFAHAENSSQQKRSVQAQKLSQPPVLDARLDDPAWKEAARLEGFQQVSPKEGAFYLLVGCIRGRFLGLATGSSSESIEREKLRAA